MRRLLVTALLVLVVLALTAGVGAALWRPRVVDRPFVDPAPVPITPRPTPASPLPTVAPIPAPPTPPTPPVPPTPTPAPASPPVVDGGFGLRRTVPGGHVLSFTFDDGPSPAWTPQVLDLLERYGARGTFFVVGREAELHPELVHEIAMRGHQLAGHTWNHVDLRTLSADAWAGEVDRTNAVLADLGGRPVTCVRPPFGSFDDRVVDRLAQRGLDTAMWSVDTRDWERPGADAIARTAIDGFADGATLLFHDGGGDRSQTLAALERVLEEAVAQGYGFTPMCR